MIVERIERPVYRKDREMIVNRAYTVSQSRDYDANSPARVRIASATPIKLSPAMTPEATATV